jgi:hypothetical protein
MKLILFIFAFCLISSAYGATYYIAPASSGGSDSNNGLSVGSPWLTPNHALNSGDVINALSGSYSSSSFQSGSWGAVSGSGHYWATLQCQTPFACSITVTSGNNDAMQITASHWIVMGWVLRNSSSSTSNGNCFEVFPATTSANITDIIIVNNIANLCGGSGIASRNNGTAGVDYIDVVGNIIYSAGITNTFGTSGISIAAPVQADTASGTHIYVAGNYVWSTSNPSGNFDGEGIILDTLDGGSVMPAAYAQQIVVDNNIVIGNGGSGIETELNNDNIATPAGPYATVDVRRNTVWNNVTGSFLSGVTTAAELYLYKTKNTSYFNNLVQTNTVGVGGDISNPDYAALVSNSDSTDSVANNNLYSSPGWNTHIVSSGSFAFGTNSTSNPGFSAPSTPSAPSCGSFASTVACMATVIANFAPGNSYSWGYQKPSLTPVVDPLFPSVLCSANIPAGLITMGCATPTTYYVRSDGGQRYDATANPTGGCNGLADAAYPGSGVNQSCAFNDIRFFWTNGGFCNDATPTSSCWQWIGTGGDTYMVRDCIQYSTTSPFPAIPSSSGPCRIGYQGPGTSDWVAGGVDITVAGDNNNAGSPYPHPGLSVAHTKILGYNFASCSSQSARAMLHGGYGVGEVIKLETTSYVDVACLDITDWSSCGRSGQTNSCSTTPGAYSDFAAEGLGFAPTMTNDTITNVRTHGLASLGVYGSPGDGLVVNDLEIVGNAGAGWNADKGDGFTGTGTSLIENFLIAWNGCSEEYPIVDALPYQDCTDDNVGGYGDGFGTATVTSSPAWHISFLTGTVNNNTQDGLDALHLQGGGSTMTVNAVNAYANMGNQIKNGAAATITNNLVGANCYAMSQSIPGTPSGFNSRLSDFCRAGNEAVIITVNDGQTSTFAYNTIWGSGWTGGGDLGGIVTDVSCTGTAALVFENNIQLGFNVGAGGAPARFTDGTGCSGGVFSQTGAVIKNNLCFGVSGGCPESGETSTLTVAPQITTTTWQPYGPFNGAPTSGSANILAAGSTCCGVTTDFLGNTRPSPPAIGAEEFISSTVATPTASPGPGTYTSTQSVTLSTATPGATICYTTDGSTPTATSPGTCSHGTTYSTAISISSTTTLQAIGTLSGDTNSAIFNGVYTITSVAPPTGLKVQGVTMQGVILQ